MMYKKSIFLCAFFIAVVIPHATHAATVSFDPQDQTVGVRSPFQLGVNLTASTSVNTISIAVRIPHGFHPVDVSDGNSIISFWIQRPTYDDLTHTVTFSGLIPGGFSGTKGRLILMTIQADGQGSGVFMIDEEHSQIYLNGPTPTLDELHQQPITISAQNARINIANDEDDTFPPETFVPVLVTLPSDKGGTVHAIAFATSDKGSGIDHYEVREGTSFLFFPTEWHVSQSPYTLLDQNLHSAIYVKAIDKKGNEQIETLPAPYPLPYYAHAWVAIVALLTVILVGIGLRALLR